MHSILITNDDGILADGIIRLAAAAREFGEVWVAAPDGQRSAASHAITLHGTIDVYPQEFPVEGVKAFSLTGTPADCVRVGCLSLMPHMPDTVLSGINYGWNAATDLQYSGTAGAALEAAFQGVRGIALSEAFSENHDAADEYLRLILAELLEAEPAPGEIFNVNFPDSARTGCRGILRDRKISRSMIYRDRYRVTEELERGGMRVMVDGQYQEVAEPDTDLAAIFAGYISVSRVRNLGY